MSNTTKSILKQNRTNPHANVMLSGKKKRKLLKEARRMVQEGLAMEVTKPSTTDSGRETNQKMDIN
jgi:cysteine sulfinate desulfinase/cysteine desulfurase-like protein